MKEAPVRLSYPCDSCGHIVGGGLSYCLECRVFLCYLCAAKLMAKQKNPVARARCPMCNEYLR
ncbi:TPA: hypothetical protein HA274_06145 [Candidatus Bathyarchaeota archaeon]|nr:hypothetical protein [Candidatus Bathyarchaeota archaeon]